VVERPGEQRGERKEWNVRMARRRMRMRMGKHGGEVKGGGKEEMMVVMKVETERKERKKKAGSGGAVVVMRRNAQGNAEGTEQGG
jgi:hypothetical protein